MNEYHAPMCRCGSRRTRRVADPFQFMARDCQDCGARYYYRLFGGHLVPMPQPTAEAIDEERACRAS